ncbi:methyltransferase domain-containing protein [bacterium]|nr:MAG: methyltransferase domain-containing protein [bacterium]
MNVNHPDYWDHIYRNERPRWDLGKATPVFENWLKSGQPLGTGRIAILGCGNGHDALLFADNGFEVTAIDFAVEPLEYLKKNIPKKQKNISLLKADIFDLPQKYAGTFDFVLEYTAYCAIDPVRRDEYVDSVYRILRPNGYLIGLFFPTDGRPGGPPFAIRYEEIDEKFLKNFSVVFDEIPEDSVAKRLGKERFVILQKK